VAVYVPPEGDVQFNLLGEPYTPPEGVVDFNLLSVTIYVPPYPVLFNFQGDEYTPPLSGSVVMDFDDAVGPVSPGGGEVYSRNFFMLLPM